MTERAEVEAVDDERLLRRDEVAELLAVSLSTLYRLVRAGKFPAPITLPIVQRTERWRLSDVNEGIRRLAHAKAPEVEAPAKVRPGAKPGGLRHA
jgi:predicted DNA-binding transcriptional regulator AlpA